MKLDEFIEDFFENLLDKEGIDTIKATVKAQMSANFKEYDETKVECQVFTEEDNFTPRVEMSSEGYSDGEIVFLDFHIDSIKEEDKNESSSR